MSTVLLVWYTVEVYIITTRHFWFTSTLKVFQRKLLRVLSEADLEVRQTTAYESKKANIFRERLNLRQFLLFYTGIQRTFNPPVLFFAD